MKLVQTGGSPNNKVGNLFYRQLTQKIIPTPEDLISKMNKIVIWELFAQVKELIGYLNTSIYDLFNVTSNGPKNPQGPKVPGFLAALTGSLGAVLKPAKSPPVNEKQPLKSDKESIKELRLQEDLADMR